MQRTSLLAGALGAALTIAAAPAFAHHSFAMFDMDAEKTVSGTVVDFQYSNPHTWIWLAVPTESGVAEQWGVEGMSPLFLSQRGWNKTTLKTGDKISVVIHPNKRGGRGGVFVRMTLPDGKQMDMTGGIALQQASAASGRANPSK
jgi:hypothetical protein